MNNPFAQVAHQIEQADQLPVLLAAALVGLELADLTTEALTELCAHDEVPGYLTAQAEVAEARDALVRAPSLDWPETTLTHTPVTTDDVAASIAAMALVLSRALVTAAERSTDPADRIACLQAALHTGRLHEALR